MTSTWFTFLFLTSICFLRSAHAQTGPTDNLQVQADLIFPMNNTQYKPTHPFPIVFAVHNFAAAWSSRPRLQWVLTQTTGSRRSTGGDDWIGWNAGSTTPQPEAHFLYINSSTAVGDYNRSTWELEYSFSVGSADCRGRPDGRQPAYWPGSFGSIFFSIDNDIDRGIMPDIAATGTCAIPLGAVAIIGKNDSNPSCAPLLKPNPAPEACAFAVNQQVADRVSQEMTKASGCKNGTWPLGTGIGRRCPNDKSDMPHSAAIAWYPTTKSLAASTILLALFWVFV